MLTLDKVNTLALEATANALIVSALTHGAPPDLPVPVIGEVKAAHATVIAGASQVAAAWGVILGPLNFQVKSLAVLIHAAPKVQFTDMITGSPENREIGDILIVIDHLRGAIVADRRAVLIQAKLADANGRLSLGESGEAQRNLYLRWPKFTMPTGYRAHERDLHNIQCKGLAVEGCRFGGIDLLGSPRDWKQIRTTHSMSARLKPRLGTSLTRMACGTAGREAVAGGTDPWSELVDELLMVTFSLTHPKQGGVLRSWETLSFLPDPQKGARDYMGSRSQALEDCRPGASWKRLENWSRRSESVLST